MCATRLVCVLAPLCHKHRAKCTAFLERYGVFKHLIVRGRSREAKDDEDKDVKICYNEGPGRIMKRFWAEICENTLD